MKKCVFLILLLIPTLLWAAGQDEMAAPSDKPAIEITKVFYFGDASDYPDLKEQYMEDFSEEFNVQLKVNTFPRNEYMEKVNLMITSRQLSGIVGVFFPANILDGRENGTILQLDEYLDDNAVWKSMPDQYRKLFNYYGGTWGIGGGYSGNPFARTFRKDWLDNLGMEMPTNTEELFEVARAFTEDDPDGNGKDDTTGIVSAGTWNLQDIFQAFDARLNNFGADPLCWDPNENAYVDSFLKPEMLDALAYLERLYEAGYLDEELFTNKGSTMREKFWSGKYGSSFYWLGWGVYQQDALYKNVPDAEVDFLLALQGNRKKNINHIVTGGTPYMMLSTTPNPDEMINAFVNTFWGDDRACLWGMHGIQGTTFRVEDDTVIKLKDSTTGNLYPSPGIVGANPTWPRDRYMDFPDGTAAEIQEAKDKKAMEARLIQEGLDAELLYHCPGNLDSFISTTYNEIIEDIRKIFDEVIVNVLTGEITPQEAQTQYINQVKALGAQQALDECNEAAGLTAPAWSEY